MSTTRSFDATTIRGWKWLPGMKAVHESGRWFRVEEESSRLLGDFREFKPDFDDTLTRLGVIDLVRRVRREPHWYPHVVIHDTDVVEYVIDPPSAKRQTLYPTELDCLLAALRSDQSVQE